MIIFRQKEFTEKDDIYSVACNGDSACTDLIKCMEFYDKCTQDIPHWVDDVITMRFKKLLGFQNLWGGLIILPGLSKKFISSEFGSEFEKYQKNFDPTKSIQEFKKRIETSKERGKLKYWNLLKKDSKGKVVWKHSDKYYVTFFEYLALFLDFRLPSTEFGSFGISEDGKIWGRPNILDSKISMIDSKITDRDFQNLILEYIYYMNYGDFEGDTELVRRIRDKI